MAGWKRSTLPGALFLGGAQTSADDEQQEARGDESRGSTRCKLLE
jgi:hypothetical protein